MVVPLLTTAGTLDSQTEEVRNLLGWVKYCVFGLWVFGLLYALFQPVNALTILGLAIFGTYLLAEDPQVASCYACLKESVIGQCCGNGGIPMLTPFLILSAISAMVDGLTLVQVFSQFGYKVLKYPQVDLLLCIWVCELVAAVLCWRVFKAIVPTLAPPEGYQQLPGGVLGGPGAPSGLAPGGPAGPRPAGARVAPSTDFQPFSGQGHRLAG